MLKGIFNIILFLLLTALTQVGGVVLLLTEIIISGFPKNWKRTVYGTILFVVIYGIFSTYALPALAKNWGKERIMPTEFLQPRSFMTILTNRNYVTSEMLAEAISVSKKMNNLYYGTVTYYYDASFPLWPWFPTLPHLSHKTGKELDLGFYYSDADGASLNPPSWIGYGFFEEPEEGELNQAAECKKQGNLFYSFTKILAPFSKKKDRIFDLAKTAALLEMIDDHEMIKTVFVEPHIAERLGVSHEKIKFHGCHSVRHDDHFHIEVR
ncbi:MAG: hypothetical protein KDC83_05235 [Flavobacteriales bacterium]|nr:hypothetical protein [Flavobacteriales bacterium]